MNSIATLLFALFACLFVTMASPIPVSDGELVELDKRVTHTGRGTWFSVGLGNCGKWNKNSDPIIAIATSRYNDNNGANCDQWVEIINTKNGKKAYGMTRDSCESCGYDDLDMSPSLFQKLDSLDVGELRVSWHFMNKGWSP